MKTLSTLPALLALAALTGCAATSPARIATQSPEALKAQSAEALCNAYGQMHSAKVRAELESRDALTAEEWRQVDARRVGIGMSRLALLCSWGQPGIRGGINRTVTAHGVSEQWVYRVASSERARYIYVREGKVSGMQD